jgi:squalene synthase HpnC
MDTSRALAFTRQLARKHYENFTVGSWLLPRDKRQHVYNLYAYARSVDDLGDEAEGDRPAQLDAFEGRLRNCYEGKDDDMLFTALGRTIRDFDIPIEPFLKLIEANRMDQHKTRFATYEELLHYCEHSANPCGRLFLYVFGYRDAARQRLADLTCTALQLTNFWQDIAVDRTKDRIYIPKEDLDRFGVTEADLDAGNVSPAFIELMKFEIGRTRELFRQGLGLLDHIRGMVKVDIRLFTLGGSRLLDAIEKNGYDVFRARPTLSRAAKTRLVIGALLGVG